MSEANGSDPIREAVLAVLRDLMPENPHVNGHQVPESAPVAPSHDAVPVVPAPPVAAVLRPSTWSGPAVPGEIVGFGGGSPVSEPPPQTAPSAPPLATPASPELPRGDVTVETVRIDGDEDLQVFVRSLVARLESPRDRLAIKAGRLRFRLERSAAPVGGPAAGAAPAVRILRGAVTERHVREAHGSGARLVLARGAVLTPLARDTARALRVAIEREAQC